MPVVIYVSWLTVWSEMLTKLSILNADHDFKVKSKDIFKLS